MVGLKSILPPTESTGNLSPAVQMGNPMAHDHIRETSGVALPKTTDDGTLPIIAICRDIPGSVSTKPVSAKHGEIPFPWGIVIAEAACS
jgi:hypothetical protein